MVGEFAFLLVLALTSTGLALCYDWAWRRWGQPRVDRWMWRRTSGKGDLPVRD